MYNKYQTTNIMRKSSIIALMLNSKRLVAAFLSDSKNGWYAEYPQFGHIVE